MTLSISQHSLLLLPTQLRLNGKFTYRGYDVSTGAKVQFIVEIEKQPHATALTVRTATTQDSITLPAAPLPVLVAQAQAFISDSINGLLDSAAGRIAA